MYIKEKRRMLFLCHVIICMTSKCYKSATGVSMSE